VREATEQTHTLEGTRGILLYLDEIQYFNKKQQQSLLEFMEDGRITLIASTTENPYFYVYNAVISRSVVFEFKSIDGKKIPPIPACLALLITRSRSSLNSSPSK
jgi:putative ATPase